jgi:hypothetical protein
MRFDNVDMGDVWLQIKDRPDLSVCVLKGLIRHSTPKKEQLLLSQRVNTQHLKRILLECLLLM